MSPRDVSNYEMGNHGNIEERDLEALLAGGVSVDDPRLGSLAEFVLEVGRVYPVSSVEALEQEHIRLMMAAVAAPLDGVEVEHPSSVADATPPSWNARVRTTLRAASASLVFKLVFGAVVAAMAVAGLRAVKEAPRLDQGGFERGTGVIGAGVDDFKPILPPQDDASEDADGVDDDATPTQGYDSGSGHTDGEERPDGRSVPKPEDSDDESDEDAEDSPEADDDESDEDSPEADDDESDGSSDDSSDESDDEPDASLDADTNGADGQETDD